MILWNEWVRNKCFYMHWVNTNIFITSTTGWAQRIQRKMRHLPSGGGVSLGEHLVTLGSCHQPKFRLYSCPSERHDYHGQKPKERMPWSLGWMPFECPSRPILPAMWPQRLNLWAAPLGSIALRLLVSFQWVLGQSQQLQIIKTNIYFNLMLNKDLSKNLSPNIRSFTPLFSTKVFTVLVLTFKSLIHFLCILCIMWGSCPISFFSMWISSVPT